MILKTVAFSRLKRGLGDNLSPLNDVFFLSGPISEKKIGNFASSTSTTRDIAPLKSRAEMMT